MYLKFVGYGVGVYGSRKRPRHEYICNNITHELTNEENNLVEREPLPDLSARMELDDNIQTGTDD